MGTRTEMPSSILTTKNRASFLFLEGSKTDESSSHKLELSEGSQAVLMDHGCTLAVEEVNPQSWSCTAVLHTGGIKRSECLRAKLPQEFLVSWTDHSMGLC